MKKQASILISVLLLISVVVITAVDVSQSSDEPEEKETFDDEPLWKVNLSEEQVLVSAVEDDQVLAMNETSLHFLEKNGEIRWSREFNESLYYRRVGRPRTIDGYILTFLQEEDTTEFTMHLIDLEDGTSIWEKSLDVNPYSVGYLVSENNNVYIISNEQLIKISEEGEELWHKEIDLSFSFLFLTRLDADGNLIGVNAGWGVEDNKVLCISPEGDLEWDMEIEEQEFYMGVTSDFKRDSIYLLNDQTMYKLDADEGVVWSRNYMDLEDVKDFTVIDERIYVFTSPDDQNFTLSEISEDGKELWNITMEFEEYGDSFHPWMDVGNDGRIYFGILNLTQEMQKLELTYAFEQDGTLAWEHHFDKNVTNFPQVSESGRIYISTAEGEIYAFQSGLLEEDPDERDPHFLLDYFWILVVIIGVVVIISIMILKLREGQVSQDTYEEEERPPVGTNRYQHRPYEWDNGSQGTFPGVNEEEQTESETEDDQ